MASGLDKSLDDLIAAKPRKGGRGAGRGGRGAGRGAGAGGRGRPLQGVSVRKTVQTKAGGVAQRGAQVNRVRSSIYSVHVRVEVTTRVSRLRELQPNRFLSLSRSARSRTPRRICGITTCTPTKLRRCPSSAAGERLAEEPSCLLATCTTTSPTVTSRRGHWLDRRGVLGARLVRRGPPRNTNPIPRNYDSTRSHNEFPVYEVSALAVIRETGYPVRGGQPTSASQDGDTISSVGVVLQELFSAIGQLISAEINFDRAGRSKGTAEVVYRNR